MMAAVLRVCSTPWRLAATASVLAATLSSCPTQAQNPPFDRIEVAQRQTRPGEVPPPAPPPPTTQPRTGVIEAPQPTPPDAPKPPSAATTPPPAPAAPAPPPRVAFEKNAAILSSDARAVLDTAAAALKADAAARALLKAYSSTGTSVSETRRLSLKRGVMVRDYLVAKGIQSTRIDVQALGNSPQDSDQDYVEVVLGKK